MPISPSSSKICSAKKLEGEKELLWICEKIEFPLVAVLASMEYAGVSIDTAHLEKASEKAGIELELLTEKIYASAGSAFNIDSPKQLAHILFNVLLLPTKNNQNRLLNQC